MYVTLLCCQLYMVFYFLFYFQAKVIILHLTTSSTDLQKKLFVLKTTT